MLSKYQYLNRLAKTVWLYLKKLSATRLVVVTNTLHWNNARIIIALLLHDVVTSTKRCLQKHVSGTVKQEITQVLIYQQQSPSKG